MAYRKVRGIYPGLLDQVQPGVISYHYLDRLPAQGKTTKSGLIVAPISREIAAGTGDPLVTGVMQQRAVPEPVSFPIAQQTRQASQQQTPFPLWIGLALLALL